jgi:uncharacterized membrane protein (DUF4010 family)
MTDFMNPQSAALGFVFAAAVGFLIGRTREQDGDPIPKPGIRDFIILALLGAVCSSLNQMAITVTLVVVVAAVILVMRVQYPQRTGITTELSALMTFLLGFLCLTPERAVGTSLGIILALLLTSKEQLHRFALKTISEREYGDTLRFLALIFVIYPLLPAGGFGPFHCIEPRKIWFFVILVAGVSYVGYFLTKFLDPAKGLLVTAVVGGLASTTAYTGGVSRVVAESPEAALPLARAALLANSIQYPRLLLIVAFISPPLALAALPSLSAMMIAGFVCAWLLGRTGAPIAAQRTTAGFKNPFTLGPALKFGLVFAAVLFFTRAGRHLFGQSGQFVTSTVGGLIDVDAVLLSLTEVFKQGGTPAHFAVLGIILAAAANSVFKSALACYSGIPAFYLRMIAGFAIIVSTGLVVFRVCGVELLARNLWPPPF